MPNRRTPPEERAKQQMSALSTATHRTLKALAKHPDDHRTQGILDWHEHQLDMIVRPKMKPLPAPVPRCRVCGKPLLIEEEVWTSDPVLKFLWAVGVTSVFLLVFAFFDWWALFVFPVAWLVSLSFLWSLTIPALLLMVVVVFLGFTGIRF
jgi:hypothetical protein